MSEEPVPFGEVRHPEGKQDRLTILTKCLVAADYGDLVVGYGALTTEAEISLVRQIGRLVQQALKLDRPASLHFLGNERQDASTQPNHR